MAIFRIKLPAVWKIASGLVSWLGLFTMKDCSYLRRFFVSSWRRNKEFNASGCVNCYLDASAFAEFALCIVRLGFFASGVIFRHYLPDLDTFSLPFLLFITLVC